LKNGQIHTTKDSKMKTPDILLPALRQYQHNDCSGLLMGFDHEITIKLFKIMENALNAQSRLLSAYRVGGQPSEWVFDALEKARKAGLEI
jgi:hypothetical protein